MTNLALNGSQEIIDTAVTEELPMLLAKETLKAVSDFSIHAEFLRGLLKYMKVSVLKLDHLKESHPGVS